MAAQDDGELRDFMLCALSEATKQGWLEALEKALAPFQPSLTASAGASTVFTGTAAPGAAAAAASWVHKSLLLKRGPKKNDAWKVRWVTLDGRTCRYFKDEHDTEQLGMFEMERVTNFWNTGHGNLPPKEAPPDLGFKLIFSLDVMDNGIREFVFCALSEADKYYWVKAIESSLSALQNKNSAPVDSSSPRPLPGGQVSPRPGSGVFAAVSTSPRPQSGVFAPAAATPPKSPVFAPRNAAAKSPRSSGAFEPTRSPRSSGAFEAQVSRSSGAADTSGLRSSGRIAPVVPAPRPPPRAPSQVLTKEVEAAAQPPPLAALPPPPAFLPPPPPLPDDLPPPPPFAAAPEPHGGDSNRVRGFTELGVPPPPEDLLDLPDAPTPYEQQQLNDLLEAGEQDGEAARRARLDTDATPSFEAPPPPSKR